MILRSVRSCHGFEAYQQFYRKFNPRTRARGLGLLMAVVNRGRGESAQDIEAGLIVWEEKAEALQVQFKENFATP